MTCCWNWIGWSFYCYELQQTINAVHRPVVVITSNNEKELPDAFLRRCFFHYIKFPERDTMKRIVDVHYPGLDTQLLEEAMRIFYEIRDIKGMKKRPSTSETHRLDQAAAAGTHIT